MTKTKAIIVFLLLISIVITVKVMNHSSKVNQDRAMELDLKLQKIEIEVERRRAEIIRNYNRRANEFRNDAYKQEAQLAEERRAVRNEYESDIKDIDGRQSHDYRNWQRARDDARSDYEDDTKRINEKYNSDSYDNLRGRLDHLDVQMQDELNKLEKLRQYWIDNAIAESKSKP